ncbi:MAG: hypothetical protein JSW65_05850, partial [Candidatus Bipolaricaulota bacterium]
GLDPVYRRPGETATIEVSANDNRIEVAARHVARYTLLISAEMFDLDRPIVVVTNGTSSFDGVVVPDPRFLLEQAARDVDRSTIYEACIEVTVHAK